MTSNFEISSNQKLLMEQNDMRSNHTKMTNNNDEDENEEMMTSHRVKVLDGTTSSSSSSSSSSTSIRGKLKSKRWIVMLTCLSLILALALIICYINYRICCSSLSNLEQYHSSSSSSFLFLKCSSSSSSGSRRDDMNFGHPSPLAASLSGAFDTDFYDIHNLQHHQHRDDTDLMAHSLDDSAGRVTSLGPAGWNSSRLPTHLIPWHYDIRLRINVYTRQFVGYCAIRVRCNQSISFLVVHADTNLQFLSDKPSKEYKPRVFELRLGAEALRNEIPVKRWDYNSFFSYYVVQLDEGRYFRRGRNYLVVFEKFHSVISNNLKGLYYSTYVTKNQTRTIVVSQLQPLEARRVFPSFDEPILKSRFSISIEHHKEFTALSNMEEKNIVRVDNAWKRTEFETTPLMSTYILAFVVCDFKPLHTTGPNGLKIRVWTRDDFINNTNYALDSIPKAYEFFEGYFNIREVVNKSDHLASPDFNAGAMENWGLVIYKESALLYDDEKSLLEDEYFVLLVICHEVSHSWFGNMATFKWWDNVWLNEAFANTLMYFAMEKIRPDFNVLETLVVHDIFTVMEKDSLETSHPVSTYVEDPNQVQQYFDEISYEKGLSVLRMLRGFIGDDNFKTALRNHVQKYKFSNCDMHDLWKVFSETIKYKYNISDIMTNWLTQEGYPVVNVTMREDRSRGKIVYELKQKMFLLSQNRQEVKNYKWVIPFTYKFEDSKVGENKLIWLNLTDSRIEVDNNDRNRRKWIYANIDFMGYFRVNYDEQNWRKITEQLKRDHTKFTALERATLLFDAFTLARIGYLSYPNTLELSSYLVNEKDYVPWKSFFKSITYLDNMLASSSCYGLFQNYCSKQINPVYMRLGWEDRGNFMERVLRTHVIKYSAYFENQDAVTKAKDKFEQYANGKKLEKNIVEAVYCAGVKYGTGKDWLHLFNKSLFSIPAEQSVLWQALICSRETWILKGLLETTLNETIIRRSDIRRIYNFYTLTAISRSIYFDFITTNWNTLLANFGNDAFLMSAILENLSIGVNDAYSLERVKQMLKKGAGAASNSPDFIIDQINSNIQWIRNNERNICNYLKDTQQRWR